MIKRGRAASLQYAGHLFPLPSICSLLYTKNQWLRKEKFAMASFTLLFRVDINSAGSLLVVVAEAA